jgi:hypothetical protein
VTRAAGLLQLLIEGVPTPSELQRLVEESLSPTPPHRTADAFSDALAFFERPNRRADVEALVARVLESAAHDDAAEELERLKARVSELADSSPPSGVVAPPTRRSTWPLAVAVAIILLGGAVAALYLAWPAIGASRGAQAPRVATSGGSAEEAGAGERAEGSTGAAADSSLLSRARDTLGAAVQAAKETLGGAPAQKAEAAPPVAEQPTAPTSTPRSRPVRTAAARASDRAPSSPPVPRLEVRSLVSEPVVEFIPEPATAASTVQRANAIYTPRDEDVLPPSLVRPTLAAVVASHVGAQRIATLDMLIDEQGDVERVTLLPEASGYHQRMYVSHAKSWKFHPATREGEPVRYRLTLRVRM